MCQKLAGVETFYCERLLVQKSFWCISMYTSFVGRGFVVQQLFGVEFLV